jgi:cation-transporting P-type ATPase E
MSSDATARPLSRPSVPAPGEALAPTGLTAAEVRERRARGEVNRYEVTTSRPVKEILRSNVLTRFNALLGALLVVILIVGPFQDALFGVTLVANTLIGVVQELRAKRTLDKLAILSVPRVAVVRDGTVREIAARDVVLDDVLQLGPGDQVAVDAVVLDSRGARLDESMLTGEARPAEKEPDDEVLSGSFVVAGSLTCRATAVGEQAYAARLASEARRFAPVRSELRDGINGMIRVITWVLVPVAVLLFWSQFARDSSFADAVRGSVAGTVTMVPEGLVLLTSVAFTVGARRLAKLRVLSRELPSIEGLARVDTLCIDKTGTLTTGHLAAGELQVLNGTEPVLAALGALARLEERPNATAVAVATAYPRRSGWVATEVVPFASAAKWSGADFGEHGSWVLGAPDMLLPLGHPLLEEVATAAGDGTRVLLVARAATLTPLTSLEPVALLSLVDELRADAAGTLAYLTSQGVDVKVISGDHPATVAALVRRLGVEPGTPVDASLVRGDDDTLAEMALERTVFGRVGPEQKQVLVNALRAAGRTVAMTGDGINDVLALKDADVGIAMGSGAGATKAVAQLVLLDDSFGAVPAVIAEGRRVIANMERVANLFITKTVYATVLAVAVGLARLPFPFLPRHLTLVSTFTIGIPAFVLALAPNEQIARPHFVARVVRFALPAGLCAAGATYLAYQQALSDNQTSTTEARTLATIVLSALALWILVILVRLGDRRQEWVVPVMAACLLVFLVVPSWRSFFALDVPRPLVVLAGVGSAALAGMALEIGWKVTGWFRPGPGQSGVVGRLRRRWLS